MNVRDEGPRKDGLDDPTMPRRVQDCGRDPPSENEQCKTSKDERAEPPVQCGAVRFVLFDDGIVSDDSSLEVLSICRDLAVVVIDGTTIICSFVPFNRIRDGRLGWGGGGSSFHSCGSQKNEKRALG